MKRFAILTAVLVAAASFAQTYEGSGDSYPTRSTLVVKHIGVTESLTLPANSVSNAALQTVSVAKGGTGATTLTGVVKGNGTSAMTAGSVALTSEVTGTLPVANGGTGAATLTGLVKGNGTSAMTAAAAGTDYLSPSTGATVTNNVYVIVDRDSKTNTITVLGGKLTGWVVTE